MPDFPSHAVAFIIVSSAGRLNELQTVQEEVDLALPQWSKLPRAEYDEKRKTTAGLKKV
jgi:hypothetical protein